MITAKFGRIAGRAALGLVLAVGIGAATISPAHAEWHGGHWGHWGWRNGVHIFVAEPYPYGYSYPYYYGNSYGYYGNPYGYYYPPSYYAPPPVVYGPSIGFGFSFGGHRHW